MSNTPPPPPPGQPYSPGQPGPGQPYGQAPHGQSYSQGQPGQASQDQPYGQHAWGPGHPPAPPVPPQPEQKRSWFRRHKIMTGLLAIVAIAVLANLFGGEDPDTPVASETPAAAADVDAPAEPAAAEEEAADDQAAQEKAAQEKAAEEKAATAQAEEEKAAEQKAADEKAAEEAAAASPGINDPASDGMFKFVVTEVETGLSTIGEGFTEEEAQGQFVVIHLSVTNVGDKAQTVYDGAQVLIDDQGRQHETSCAAIWLDEGLWLDAITPGNSMDGILVYDIPQDAVPTSLELHDSLFSGGVTVSLT